MKTRLFQILVALFAITALLSPAATAQDATPAAGLDSFGLPTLDVTVTADSYEGIPESVPAGRYLLNVTSTEENVDGGGVGFIQPVGISVDEFIAAFSMPAGGEGTPVAEDEAAASPADGEGEGEESGPPAFLFDSVFAGGAYAPPGGTAQAIIDLTPGEWVAWGDDPEAPWAPVALEVTGEMPTDLVEPTSTATLTISEYIIDVTAGEFVAGPQIVRIENIGAQPHFVNGVTTQKEITNEDVAALLAFDMTGTPAAVDFDPDTDLTDVFFTGTQSMGTSTWVQIDLPPGNLVMLCFFPDLADGLPHAYHGMHNVVNIPE